MAENTSEGRDSKADAAVADQDYCDFSEPNGAENLCVYQHLFDHSADAIVVVNPEGIIVNLNPRFGMETKARREEVIGRHFLSVNLLTRPSLDRVRDHFLRLVAGESSPAAFDVEVLTRDGRVLPFELTASPIPGPEGSVIAVLAAFRNLSRRKQFEKDLQDIKDFLEAVINAVPDPIFVKDQHHRWVLLNDAFCDFIGRPRDQLVGKTDFDFFPRREAEIFWKTDSRVFSSGKENLNKESFTDAAGRPHVVRTRKQLFAYPGSGEKFLVGVIQVRDDRRASKRGWGHLGERIRRRREG